MLNKNILQPLNPEQVQGGFENFAQVPFAILKKWSEAELNFEFLFKGQPFELSVAQTMAELEAIKALDDLAFGQHLGITLNELQEISQNGKVFQLFNQEKQLVGELQLLTAPIPEHQHLEPDEAYSYGVGIHPDFQNQGLSQVLYFAQELVAQEVGKTKVTLTVRLENAQSIRAQLKAGYQVTGYDKDHYGSIEENGARLLMEKKLGEPVVNYDSKMLSLLVVYGVIPLANQENLEELLNKKTTFALPVVIGDEVDFIAHDQVEKIFSKPYQGIALLKPNEFGGKDPQVSLLIFAPKEKGKNEKN